MEDRIDLGLREDGSLIVDKCGLGQCSTNSSPLSSPLYPPGFEPTEFEPRLLLNRPNLDRSTILVADARTDMSNGLRYSDDEDVALANMILNYRRKK